MLGKFYKAEENYQFDRMVNIQEGGWRSSMDDNGDTVFYMAQSVFNYSALGIWMFMCASVVVIFLFPPLGVFLLMGSVIALLARRFNAKKPYLFRLRLDHDGVVLDPKMAKAAGVDRVAYEDIKEYDYDVCDMAGAMSGRAAASPDMRVRVSLRRFGDSTLIPVSPPMKDSHAQSLANELAGLGSAYRDMKEKGLKFQKKDAVAAAG